ncbi:hypothetical protein GC173_14785 [bacterium]|nr:hypothetical protein [bacterium]
MKDDSKRFPKGKKAKLLASRILSPGYSVGSDECDFDDPFFDVAEEDSKCRSLLILPKGVAGPSRYFHHSSGHEQSTNPCPLAPAGGLELKDARRISRALDALTDADHLVIHEEIAEPVVDLVKALRSGAETSKPDEAPLLLPGGRNLLIRSMSGSRKDDLFCFLRSPWPGVVQDSPIGTRSEMPLKVAFRVACALAAIDEAIPARAPAFHQSDSFLTIVPTLAREVLGLPFADYREALGL